MEEEFVTYSYSDNRGCLEHAENLYCRYCSHLFTDPARAKSQMISGIQVALRQAYAQGMGDSKKGTTENPKNAQRGTTDDLED